jgi:hypothetical protein
VDRTVSDLDPLDKGTAVNLPTVPADKANHIIDGAAVFIITAWIAQAFGLPGHLLLGLACTVAAGAAKEGSDWFFNRRARLLGAAPTHGVEFLDFAATCAGGLAVYFAVTAL